MKEDSGSLILLTQITLRHNFTHCRLKTCFPILQQQNKEKKNVNKMEVT